MTPDGYTNLQLINTTRIGIYSGTGGTNQGFYNQYQMSSWFPDVGSSALVLGPQSCATFNIQFSRGVGDEDDGADIQLNLGSGNAGPNNAVWIQARSNQNSAHYIQAVIQQPSVPGVGPLIVATTKSGKWPMQGSAGLTYHTSTQTAQLGLPNGDQCLAIIDLLVLFPLDLARLLQGNILNGGVSDVDAKNIWLAVMNWMGWQQVGSTSST